MPKSISFNKTLWFWHFPTAISTYAQDEQVKEEEVVSFEPIVTGMYFYLLMIKKPLHLSNKSAKQETFCNYTHPFIVPFFSSLVLDVEIFKD